MKLDVLRKRAEKISSGNIVSVNMLNYELRVIPGMNFSCNGTLTSLLLGVDIRTVTGSRNKYPEVQIWRYNSSITTYDRQDRREIRLAAGNFTPDGVLVYDLTPPMQFQSGDVLGVYQPPEGGSVVRLYYIVNDSAPDAYIYLSWDDDGNPSFLPSSAFNISNEYILLSAVAGWSIVVLTKCISL